MATTSTVPAVVASLLTALNANLPAGTKAYESWPGPEAAKEMVIFGKVRWDDYAIATIKAGRKQRQENWALGFEVFVSGGAGTSPANPTAAKDRAFVLLTELEDFLAEDVTGGTDFATVQWIDIRPLEAEPRVFEKGWAYRISGEFLVHARLT